MEENPQQTAPKDVGPVPRGEPPTPLDNPKTSTVSRTLPELLLARQRAREAFQQVLLEMEAAARTPAGVTPELEARGALARAAWRKAEDDLSDHLRQQADS